MKRTLIYLLFLLILTSCSHRAAPSYPAGDDGITRMRLDSARYFSERRDTRRSMIQLKAAERHLQGVSEDSLRFLTYYRIALLNERSGAYRVALTYFDRASHHATGVKLSHRLADIFIGKAQAYNQMGRRDSALLLLKRAEAFRPRIRHDQTERIARLRTMIAHRQVAAVPAYKDVEMVQIQDRFETAVAQRDALRQRLNFLYSLLLLVATAVAAVVWYRWRMRQLFQKFQQRMREIDDNIQATLRQRDTTIEEMKTEIDQRVKEMEKLRGRMAERSNGGRLPDSIAQTKLGIDTLHAIVSGGNLSQMGKREQQAVAAVMGSIDYDLACILNHPRYALTPKETFYCIMEHRGMTEEQKAAAFSCTGQALRSIKSRLGKKMNLDLLRPWQPDGQPAGGNTNGNEP